MTMKTFTIAAAVAITAALSAGTAGAHDKGSHISMKMEKHESHEHYGPRVRFYVGPSYDSGCGYYYDKWQYTGSFTWKKQYFICKGWW